MEAFIQTYPFLHTLSAFMVWLQMAAFSGLMASWLPGASTLAA